MSGKGFALGALLGGLVGGMTALLYAPKSGKKMRKVVTKRYQQVSDEAHDLMEDVCNHSIEWAEKAKKIADEAESVAKNCKRRLH